MSTPNILLNVNGIEVIYNHVILVLKGVSLQVPEGRVVALLGGKLRVVRVARLERVDDCLRDKPARVELLVCRDNVGHWLCLHLGVLSQILQCKN